MDISTLPQALHSHQKVHHELTGRAVFDGTYCQYAEEIKPGDMIAANFDVKDVDTGGGLYLLEAHREGHATWRGCRRMMRVAHGVAIDQDGHGDWMTVQDMKATAWKVVGVVDAVYKDASNRGRCGGPV